MIPHFSPLPCHQSASLHFLIPNCQFPTSHHFSLCSTSPRPFTSQLRSQFVYIFFLLLLPPTTTMEDAMMNQLKLMAFFFFFFNWRWRRKTRGWRWLKFFFSCHILQLEPVTGLREKPPVKPNQTLLLTKFDRFFDLSVLGHVQTGTRSNPRFNQLDRPVWFGFINTGF